MDLARDLATRERHLLAASKHATLTLGELRDFIRRLDDEGAAESTPLSGPPLFSPFREAPRRRNYVDPRLAARLAEKDDRDRWIAGVKRRLGLVGIGEIGYRLDSEIRFERRRRDG